MRGGVRGGVGKGEGRRSRALGLQAVRGPKALLQGVGSVEQVWGMYGEL